MSNMDASQQLSPLAAPSVPPRPSRVKSPSARVAVDASSTSGSPATGPGHPVIPPRPSRSKQPWPASTTEDTNIFQVSAGAPAPPPLSARQSIPPTVDEENPVQSQAELNREPEPERTIASIPSDMEVHAPIARNTASLPSTRPGFLRSTSLGTSTPPRSLPKSNNDAGIPEIGRQVPMYPNAGDVQAPTPTPSRQAAILAQQKKGPRSSSPYVGKKEDYGEYGSGLHPLERRSGHYSLSSDDLNQIVAQTATPISGITGVPEEELGYLASEEYAKKIGSATPREELTESEANKFGSSLSREGSTSPEISIHVEPRAHQRSGSHPYGRHNFGRFSQSQASLAAETPNVVDNANIPEEDAIRDEHYHGTPILASDEIHKRGTSTPMVPAVSPPLLPRRTTSRPASRAPSRPASRGAHREPPATAEPEGTPDAQISFTPLAQVEEHEPLFPDDEEEKHTALREGLEKAFAGRAGPAASRNSRKFPSNDIWEDAPPSSHLHATVTSPPPGLSPLGLSEVASGGQPAKAGEEQDEESDRLGVPNRHKRSQSPPQEAPPKPERPSVLSKTASGKQRFPSKDIWEEAPDSAQLTATVSPTPVSEEDPPSPVAATSPLQLSSPSTEEPSTTTTAPLEESTSAERSSTHATLDSAAKPEIPPRPASPERNQKWAPTGAVPIIPARPGSRVTNTPSKLDTQDQIEQAQTPSLVPRTGLSDSTEKKSPPVVPDRPKPAVPQRPVKINAKTLPFQQAQPEETSPVTKAPPPVKPKPAIGGKIAALKANLELEKRLAAGPMGFKRKEEEEKKPEEAAEKQEEAQALVSDVRKGRAKGPRGRKLPTAATSAAAAPAEGEAKEPAPPALHFVSAWTVWSIDDEENARVVLEDQESKAPEPEAVFKTVDEPQESLARQVLIEMVDPPVVVPNLHDSKLDEQHSSDAGLISAAEHPQDAAPKGESALDQEEPVDIPPVSLTESAQEEEQLVTGPAAGGPVVEEEGDGDWDVVSKV
ncbi:altered inheritance of mitochondria protein 21 [Kalaharituber pfeilii]|nr:altered inheritance of mitochondria protein 21 [Kalaharituber pfeilii]